ncbi:hypothetical protein JCM10914A_23910 [Paenibacillus sp. JCM 10914]|uniref:response regulator n=1 Tax=Paenibacillus sp. JCM 10914 TaxID=1236974 RepID=UPI0003CC8244|nr:response regulator [Paenibacillus sp. JCM 10914]GAE06059.1 response regulator receiver protein [Paenibacillus sp. JCM 10914]
MRILIVDDEPLVRIGIKSAIDWKAQGVDIVGEAGDGQEALQMIAELAPDVVLLDIKMPKMDGIEVLRIIRDRGIPVHTVVLSSFDDMQYVKEALKLGAFDYFHKPDINESELTAMLQNIREQFELGSSSSTTMHKNPVHQKAQWLHDALHGQVSNLKQTRLRDGNMYVLLFMIKDYHTVLKRYTQETASILPSTVNNVVGEIIKAEREVEYLQLDDQRGVVFVSNSEHKSLLASLNRVNQLTQMISSALKRFVNIEIVFGISDWFADYEGIPAAYGQAANALSQQFYQPEQAVFYYQHMRFKQHDGKEQADEYVTQMKAALREGRADYFLELLSRWETRLEQEASLEEKEVRKIYEGLLFMMDNGDYAASDSPSEGQELERLTSFAELSAHYRDWFEERLLSRQRTEHRGYSQLTRNIIEYTEEHYAQSLSLKLFGDLFHVSPNYVSRLFKQEVGQGLFDYINELRIEKSKALLKDYRYKIYDVAEMVGFSNQAHFAIVFQKYTGVSPKQYRKEEV